MSKEVFPQRHIFISVWYATIGLYEDVLALRHLTVKQEDDALEHARRRWPSRDHSVKFLTQEKAKSWDIPSADAIVTRFEVTVI